MEIKINLNDQVKVKLTAFGEAVLMHHRLRTFEKLGGSLNPCEISKLAENIAQAILEEYLPDSEGYCSFQLYELMDIFSTGTGVAAQQIPFIDNTIIFTIKDDR